MLFLFFFRRQGVLYILSADGKEFRDTDGNQTLGGVLLFLCIITLFDFIVMERKAIYIDMEAFLRKALDLGCIVGA